AHPASCQVPGGLTAVPALPLSLNALDAEVAALREAAGQLAVTLMALDDDPTRATLGQARGQTAARWQPASADLAAACAQYPQFSERVDGLVAWRGTGRKPGRDTVTRLRAALRAGIDLVAAGATPAACARLTAASRSPAVPGSSG